MLVVVVLVIVAVPLVVVLVVISLVIVVLFETAISNESYVMKSEFPITRSKNYAIVKLLAK